MTGDRCHLRRPADCEGGRNVHANKYCRCGASQCQQRCSSYFGQGSSEEEQWSPESTRYCATWLVLLQHVSRLDNSHCSYNMAPCCSAGRVRACMCVHAYVRACVCVSACARACVCVRPCVCADIHSGMRQVQQSMAMSHQRASWFVKCITHCKLTLSLIHTVLQG